MYSPNKSRRAAIVCVHFIRNLGFFRAGWDGKVRLFLKSDLWATINSNFIDIAVLEWCKLFGDSRARHHWGQVVVDGRAFFPQLLADLAIAETEWTLYVKGIREYRDKFVAHLDDFNIMNIPRMEVAEKATYYLYDTIKAESDLELLQGLPRNLQTYYKDGHRVARDFYAD
jgi:hypothetical protein